MRRPQLVNLFMLAQYVDIAIQFVTFLTAFTTKSFKPVAAYTQLHRIDYDPTDEELCENDVMESFRFLLGPGIIAIAMITNAVIACIDLYVIHETKKVIVDISAEIDYLSV